MRDCLVQILQQFAHAGHWDAEGLNKKQQLLRLQVLQGCETERVTMFRLGEKRQVAPNVAFLQQVVPASTSRETSDLIILSFNQSGSSRASSEVSTRKAVGSGFLSGNQMSRRA